MPAARGNEARPQMRPLAHWLHELFPGELPRDVLLRVDAGAIPGVSFGHLSRCLCLARALRASGARCRFLMRDIPEGLAHAASAGFEALPLPPAPDQAADASQETMRCLEELGCDCLVHDLPYAPLDEDIFHACRETGIFSLFIDDVRGLAPPADVVLNASVLALDMELQPADCHSRLLLGPRYFIFDHDPDAPASGETAAGPEVLLTFGGSDPAGLTRLALDALLAESWPGIRFTVLLGPGYRHVQEVAQLLEARPGFDWVHNPEDPVALFRRCAFAVCAGGLTMYELLSLGKGFMPVASAAHEARHVRGFLDRGWIRCGFEAWPGAKDFAHELRRQLQTLQAGPAAA